MIATKPLCSVRVTSVTSPSLYPLVLTKQMRRICWPRCTKRSCERSDIGKRSNAAGSRRGLCASGKQASGHRSQARVPAAESSGQLGAGAGGNWAGSSYILTGGCAKPSDGAVQCICWKAPSKLLSFSPRFRIRPCLSDNSDESPPWIWGVLCLATFTSLPAQLPGVTKLTPAMTLRSGKQSPPTPGCYTPNAALLPHKYSHASRVCKPNNTEQK